METINAGHLAPIGYTRSYVTMAARGCERHSGIYTRFCSACDWTPVSHRIALKDDVIALILDREGGDVIEWLTDDSGVEFAQTVAHDGIVVIREDVWQNLDAHPVARAAVHEATLYADCFGVTDALPESEA